MVRGAMKVNCLEIQELLSDYIDGLLPKDMISLVNEHLSDCSICRNEYEKLQSILQECRKIEPVNLPPNFQAVLHESLVRERNKRLLWKRSVKGMVGTAAALLILFSAFQLSYLVDGGNEKSSQHASPEIFQASPAEYSIQADVEDGETQENAELFHRAERDSLQAVPEEDQESLANKEEDTTGTARSFEEDAAKASPSDNFKELETGETEVQQYHKASPKKAFTMGILRALFYLIITGSILYGIKLLWKRKGKKRKGG